MTNLFEFAITAAEEESSSGGGILSFALLPLMLLAMYFLIIRPNSKKRKEAVALQSGLEIGDEVMTTGGIIGTITGEDGPTRFWLEVDDDVQVRIARGGIQGKIEADEADAASGADDPADAADADESADAVEPADND